MNLTEFSLEFDILYNNIMSGKAPGLNEYEKSVFLTMAQEQLLKNYFSPKSNPKQEGIGDSIKRDLDFSNLIITAAYSSVPKSISFYNNSKSFPKPSNLFLPLEFKLRVIPTGEMLLIEPLKDEEIRRLLSKPYKEPFKGTAFKLDDVGASSSYDFIVGKKYKNKQIEMLIRYIKTPRPIILTDLNVLTNELGLTSFALTIRGESGLSECELVPSLHSEVLRIAVNLAKIHYEGNTEMIVQYSSLSE